MTEASMMTEATEAGGTRARAVGALRSATQASERGRGAQLTAITLAWHAGGMALVDEVLAEASTGPLAITARRAALLRGHCEVALPALAATPTAARMAARMSASLATGTA